MDERQRATIILTVGAAPFLTDASSAAGSGYVVGEIRRSAVPVDTLSNLDLLKEGICAYQ